MLHSSLFTFIRTFAPASLHPLYRHDGPFVYRLGREIFIL